jgi:hypothetical protein
MPKFNLMLRTADNIQVSYAVLINVLAEGGLELNLNEREIKLLCIKKD